MFVFLNSEMSSSFTGLNYSNRFIVSPSPQTRAPEAGTRVLRPKLGVLIKTDPKVIY